MGNKKLIIGIIVAIAFIGSIILIKSIASKQKSRKAVPAAGQVKKDLKKATAQKVISKGKGALTVKISNSKNMDIPMKIKAFKVIDAKSSVYATSSVGGRMQEVSPGTYDIEIDTVPQKIFKNIKVAEGKETIEGLGCATGSLVIKAINTKKAAAFYPVRILYAKTNDMVTAYMTNKAIEIVPGIYDIEIGTSPRAYKKDVKVEAGKEVVVDMGCLIGTLTVKTMNEDGKDIRSSVRIMRADNNEIVSSGTSNKPVELGKGAYNVEVLSSPRQSRKDVKVNVGEESAIEFTIKTTAVPQKPAAPKPAVKLKQQR